LCGIPMTDLRDNRSYPTILIGSQCWLAKNLNYGTMISSASTQDDNCVVEKYCPGDMASGCATFGGFYQWDELMAFDASPGAQGLCPPGWHVPAVAEWLTLLNYYGQQSQAGLSLKAPAPGGFNALLSGILYQNNTWALLSGGVSATFFWTSTASGALQAVSHGLNNLNASVSDYPANRGNGMAVRCLHD
ncbi:MAG: FISUMP domain-containing protein, partial [Bacteroidota bacterium]